MLRFAIVATTADGKAWCVRTMDESFTICQAVAALHEAVDAFSDRVELELVVLH